MSAITASAFPLSMADYFRWSPTDESIRDWYVDGRGPLDESNMHNFTGTAEDAVNEAVRQADARQIECAVYEHAGADTAPLFTAVPSEEMAPVLPAVGTRVGVPEWCYRPTIFAEDGGVYDAVVGTVIEATGRLVAVKFDDYRNTVDYTLPETAFMARYGVEGEVSSSAARRAARLANL